MALSDLFELLHQLKNITPQVSQKLSGDLQHQYNTTVQKISEIVMQAEREDRDMSLLLNVVKSLRNENENLRKQSNNGSQKITSRSTVSNPITSRNTIQNIISQKISQQKSSLSSGPETVKESSIDSPTVADIFGSSDTITEDAITVTEFSGKIENAETIKADITSAVKSSEEEAVTVKDQHYEAPETAQMEIDPIYQNKPVNFYETTKVATSKSSQNEIENLKDYFTEEETMKQLQMSEKREVDDLVNRKRLEAFVHNGKRYFSKKEVSLIRSLTMELATIVVQKPKKKNPLQFWKD